MTKKEPSVQTFPKVFEVHRTSGPVDLDNFKDQNGIYRTETSMYKRIYPNTFVKLSVLLIGNNSCAPLIYDDLYLVLVVFPKPISYICFVNSRGVNYPKL